MKRKMIDGQAVKEFVGRGTALWKKDRVKWKKLLLPTAVFLSALILGGTECIEGVYPFGIIVLCAAGGTVNTCLAFAGAMLSTLGMGESSFWQILALCTALFARLISGVIYGAQFTVGSNEIGKKEFFRERSYVRVCIAAGVAAALGGVWILRGESLYFSIYSAVAGVLLCGGLTGAFLLLLSDSAGKSGKTAGVCAVAFAVTLTAEAIPTPFSIGVVLSVFFTVWAAYSGGVAAGISVGFSSGLALGPDIVPALSLAGGLAGMMFPYGDTAPLIVSVASSFLYLTAVKGFSVTSSYVPETVFTVAIILPLIKFGVLPRDTVGRLTGESEAFSYHRDREGDNGIKERLKKISDSMEALSKLLLCVSDKISCPTDEEAYRICTGARAKYCSDCEFSELCSGEREREVTSFFTNMSHGLSQRGKVTARIVPDSLARRCYNMDKILDSVNVSAKRLAGLSPAAQKTELRAADYRAVSELLRETAEPDGDSEKDIETAREIKRQLSVCGFDFREAAVYGKRIKRVYMYGVDCASVTAGEADIRRCAEETAGCRMSPIEFSIEGKFISAEMHTVPAFSVKSGKFSSIGERDIASGDSVAGFENGDGFYYSLVSDGMGSGREAAMTSGLSAVFLEKLLSAGCPMKSALELLNCFVRDNGSECFTTVDLMEADLVRGKARFIKSGAAPSFVLRGGQLFRLHSKTVPVGIMRALDAEAISFDLCDDDTVIMISDGVTGNYEDCPWLYELLCDGLKREDSPSKMAKMIGEAAIENTGREDDITVCVMKVCKL